MNKRDAQNISDKLVDALFAIANQKGVSAYRISKETGISTSSLSYIENHKQHPTYYTLVMIADSLDVEFSKIVQQTYK